MNSSPTATPDVRVQRAMQLFQQQRFAEAEMLLREAQSRDPGNAEIAYHRGNTLAILGRVREAATEFQRCVTRRPDFAPAFNNLGNALRDLGDLPQALAAFQAAIRLRPDAIVAISNAGLLLHTLGRFDEAEQLLRRGLAVEARYANLHLNLGIVLKDSGDAAGAIQSLRAACELAPTNAHAHSMLLYTLSFTADDPAVILTEAQRWQQRHGNFPALSAPRAPAAQAPQPAASAPSTPPLASPKRIRIGYLGADFRDHCQSLFMLPLLTQHDRTAFEITCYSLARRPDDYTDRLRQQAEHWFDVAQLDDAALAARIHHDGLDILIDLTMHMAGGRPGALARKPAPLQISWLAYPGTTGVQAVDYRISDPRLDPSGTESAYTERTLRLPDTFWCYDPLAGEPAPNELPALANGYVTFGCLNNPCKLTDQALRLWAPLLSALPEARLLLLVPAGAARERLRARLDQAGIPSERVQLVGHQPRAEYLRLYHQIDLCLDTLPYNGHTTSLDAFWMGVPVITRVGNTCAGRAGLSQLFNLGLTELAADTDTAFTQIALALARDLPRLAALRSQLRPRMAQSPLMDSARFARNIEALYRRALAPSSGAPA